MTTPSFLLHCQLLKQVSFLLHFSLSRFQKQDPEPHVQHPYGKRSMSNPTVLGSHGQKCGCLNKQRKRGSCWVSSLQGECGILCYWWEIKQQEAKVFSRIAKMFSSPEGTLWFLLTLNAFPDRPENSLSSLLCVSLCFHHTTHSNQLLYLWKIISCYVGTSRRDDVPDRKLQKVLLGVVLWRPVHLSMCMCTVFSSFLSTDIKPEERNVSEKKKIAKLYKLISNQTHLGPQIIFNNTGNCCYWLCSG